MINRRFGRIHSLAYPHHSEERAGLLVDGVETHACAAAT
jgi:hypothetical protein